MTALTEISLKERLKTLAYEQKTTFKDISKKLFLERFLVRLGKSDYVDKLIFKGGRLLSYYLETGRETKDLDFLLSQINAEKSALEKMFCSICSIDVSDGFLMDFDSMKALNQAGCVVFQVSLRIKYTSGTMRDRLRVDIGVGDEVTPQELSLKLMEYKSGYLFEDSVSLKVYPPEAIFAEKLESIVSKGGFNSRMKDFYDLILMVRKQNFLNQGQLKDAINKTFGKRGTGKQLPLKFDDADYGNLETHWKRYGKQLREVGKESKMPNCFREVVFELNTMLECWGILD